MLYCLWFCWYSLRIRPAVLWHCCNVLLQQWSKPFLPSSFWLPQTQILSWLVNIESICCLIFHGENIPIAFESSHGQTRSWNAEDVVSVADTVVTRVHKNQQTCFFLVSLIFYAFSALKTVSRTTRGASDIKNFCISKLQLIWEHIAHCTLWGTHVPTSKGYRVSNLFFEDTQD